MNPINETNNSVMPLIVAAAVITVIILLAVLHVLPLSFWKNCVISK